MKTIPCGGCDDPAFCVEEAACHRKGAAPKWSANCEASLPTSFHVPSQAALDSPSFSFPAGVTTRGEKRAFILGVAAKGSLSKRKEGALAESLQRLAFMRKMIEGMTPSLDKIELLRHIGWIEKDMKDAE